MHWADVMAEELLRKGDRHRIATGITPSGHIHVGNMREILTGDLIHRALKDHGGKSTLVYLGDTFDPLRKVYPFLDASKYRQYVGRPLSEIPCPCGGHENYAAHFLEPFLESLDRLGVEYSPLMTHELYRSGDYAEAIRKAIEERETIREILERVSGRSLPPDWFPYTPKCASCGTFGGVVTGYRYPFVEYMCRCTPGEGHGKGGANGSRLAKDTGVADGAETESVAGVTGLPEEDAPFEGRADIRTDDGKLPWRVDWAARWWFLDITCEPFGKDHGAAGGSYDTGKELSETIFGRLPPHPLMYEWIQLKGKGAMSSSSGIVVTGAEMLMMTPPEVLRYLIARQNPSRHIDFDPGLGILTLVDEYDRCERVYYGHEGSPDTDDLKRTYILSEPHGAGRPPETMALQIPYRHLVTLVQLTDDPGEIKARIMRSEKIHRFTPEADERLRERIRCVRYWLDTMAPEGVKFALRKAMPDIELSHVEGAYLATLTHALADIHWEAESIHTAIHDASGTIGAKQGFATLYKVFLGQSRGPRLGFFLSSLDRGFVLERLSEASTAGGSA